MKITYGKLLMETMETADTDLQTKQTQFDGGTVTEVTLTDGNPFGKPAGRYITVETDHIQTLSEPCFGSVMQQISRAVESMLTGTKVLVAALGNEAVTPDSLGPKMTSHLMVTRPLETVQPSLLRPGNLRSVAAICTNVYGTTGVESAELVAGLCHTIHPDTVILIDALSTSHLSRLCTTVQISDTGISPGAGLGNYRPEISEQALGVRVISVGMPTVMQANEFAEQLTDTDLSEHAGRLIVTPQDIAAATDNGARLIAFALNHALHYGLSTEDMLKYLS